MALENVKALRTAILADQALKDFCLSEYGKSGWTVMAGHKKLANAGDYPAISLVPAASSHDNARAFRDDHVSIVVGVNDKEIKGGVVKGFERLDTAVMLVMQSIRQLIGNNVRVVWDLGERHPFYEAELIVQVFQHRTQKTI